MALEEFVSRTLELLDKERDAEIEETQSLMSSLKAKELEKKGVCLLKLQLKSRRSGLYGRMVASFEPRIKGGDKNTKPELPSHNISPGDIVGVSEMRSEVMEKPLVTGIVFRVSSGHIDVACDESQDVFELNDDDLFKLVKLANDVTYRRLKGNLKDLNKYSNGPSQRLIDIFFNLSEVSPPIGDLPMTFVNERLDPSQREAVRFALAQREVAIIHGPPGTGKTTTVVELIVQAVRRGLKVLATAPSNIAVDNLVERLATLKQKIVRIGHPARLLSHLQQFSLDALVNASEEKGLAKDVRTDIQKVLTKMKKARGAGERRGLREELKLLQRESREREATATREVLTRADVVLVTLASASGEGPLKYLKEEHFDLVIIDECSQALEAACWLGLLRAPKCVLAGDHLQLPPTILSKEAAREGLELTLMERLLKLLSKDKDRDVVRMLTTQYRMHQDIMAWSSQQLYEDRLTAHPSVESHLLSDLDHIADDEIAGFPLLLIDTAGCDLGELDLPEEVSKGNEGEADIVAAHVEDLVSLGLRPLDIAVIAPYNMQVDLIRTRLLGRYPDLEVKSVDGFQGREKEAVIITMVRSNPKGEVGFLAERRRINVAVTRARRHLAVVCDSETVSHDPFIKTLMDYMMEKGEHWSAHQYIQEGKVSSLTAAQPARTFHLTDGAQSKKNNKDDKKKWSKSKSQPLKSVDEKAVEFKAQLQGFLADPEQTEVNFPASLNSHDRMVIHTVAEELGLAHGSVGEGEDRHIRVTKAHGGTIGGSVTEGDATASVNDEDVNSVRSSSELLQKAVSDEKHSNAKRPNDNIQGNDEENLSCQSKSKNVPVDTKDSTSNISKEDDKQGELPKVVKRVNISVSICSFCKREIPRTNLSLHELHCQKQSLILSMKAPSCKTEASIEEKSKKNNEQSFDEKWLENTAAKSETGKKKDVRPKEKKPKTKQKTTHVQKAADSLQKIDDDDFDGLIASITLLDSKCAFKKCKTLTNTLGRFCELCTRRFCIGHLQPEVHGCGAAAKVAARRVISRDGVLHQGSGQPNRKPDKAKRAQLENRLGKKLGDLADQRGKKDDKKKS